MQIRPYGLKHSSHTALIRPTEILLFVLITAVCLSVVPVGGGLLSTKAEAGGNSRRSAPRVSGLDGEVRRQVNDAYGKLPLRFEANCGQADGSVKFLARGDGYSLLLTGSGALMHLRKTETPKGGGPEYMGPQGAASQQSTLHIDLDGANRSPKVVGADELAGRSNYLVGADARRWRAGIPAFAKVRYESVYPGVDMVYYGREGRLEYDFLIAPGVSPSRIRLRFAGARAVRIDEGGDLVLATDAGDLRQQKPTAYQEVGGERREVQAHYVKESRGRVGIELGSYDHKLPLVIDPLLLYSSYIGDGNQEALTVAVGPDGSAYIAGDTASTTFPGPSSIQASKGASTDAYVLKLSPDGKSLVYATYLGGDGNDTATRIALDAAGNAYVTGWTTSSNFPTTAGAAQPALADNYTTDGFVTKLNSSGTALVYSTYLGGDHSDKAAGIAVDADGAAYVIGTTNSTAIASTPVEVRGGHAVLKSTDGAGHWSAADTGLPSNVVNAFAAQPTDPNVIYAATEIGLFKSTDAGTSWHSTGTLPGSIRPAFAISVAVDPSDPNTVYAGMGGGFYKSTDGGNSFTQKNSGMSGMPNSLLVAPTTPSTLYAGLGSGVYKSTDGGESWTKMTSGITGSIPLVSKLAFDPSNPSVVYAGAGNGVFKTTNGGGLWSAVNTGLPSSGSLRVRALAEDPTNPSTLYVTLVNFADVYKSTDGGAHWAVAGTPVTFTTGSQTFNPFVNSLVVDPTSSSTLYAGTLLGGVFKSTDGGASWAASNGGLTNKIVNALLLTDGNAAAVYAGTSAGNDIFVAKLNPAGSQLAYLKTFAGSENDTAASVAVGQDGSAYIAGTTWSSDFPVVNAFQQTLAGSSDAFVAKINPAGSALTYSTFLGGLSVDEGLGIAVDASGSAYVTGDTLSSDFPLSHAAQPAKEDTSTTDAFVTKFAPDGGSLVYSTYVGGSSSDSPAGIAVGSDGSAYITGETISTDFPVKNAVQPAIGGSFGYYDAFVTKLDPSGSAFAYSTYLGGWSDDQGTAIAVDPAGGAYVVGSTFSSDFPVVNPLAGNTVHTGSFVTKIGSGTDLAVSMNDSPDPVTLGSDLTYTIVVKNNGDLQATGVTLTDVLPAGASLVSATTNLGSCSGTTTVVCGLGALGGGESEGVVITVKPPAVRTINNTATVTLNESDATLSNNSATVSTTVDFADLSLTQRSTHDLAAPGSRLSYVIRVTNKGPAVAPSVRLTDALPSGTTFAACAATGGGICSNSGNTVTVAFASLPVGASEAVTVSATLDAATTEGTVISNTASVASSIADPATDDNSATTSVTVRAQTIAPKGNGLIVFGSDRAFTNSTQPTGLYTVKPDGTGEKFLGFSPFFAHPSWSPDGSKLAFAQGANLMVSNPDGSGAVTIATNVSNFNHRISWSPDGAQLAYIGDGTSSKPETLRTINLANADGSGFSMLPNSPNSLEAADWSPDGTKFLYTNGSAISVMNFDGTGQTQLTFPPVGSDGQTFDHEMRWSPDGTRVLFERWSNNFNDVYLMNADGSGQTKLLNIFRTKTPAWSPDGSQLVFESLNDLYVINLDGSGQVALTHGFYNFTPDWQPVPGASPTPTPTPAPTFSISGHLTAAPGQQGQPFGTVTLKGTRNATAEVSGGGTFTFVHLPAGGDYSLSASNDSYSFTPATRDYKNLSADVTDADFEGTFVPANITGHVTDSQGHPLAGIKMTSSGGFPEGTTLTDANGFYSFPNVQRARTYSIFPDPFTPYSFDPPQRLFGLLRGSVTADFVGTRQPTNVIGGRVVEASTGLGVGGLLVSLARDNNAADFTFTDASGNFTFGDRPSNHQYSVSVTFTTTFVIEPTVNAPNPFAQIVIANLASDQNLLFTGARRNTVQIASDMSPGEGDGHVDLTVTRSGDTSAPATVNYSTADGTASDKSDYTTAIGTLRFGANETSKTVTVLLSDDALVEGEESFTLNLEAPVGAQLGGLKTATVRIKDNDTMPGGANPLDDGRFFVRQHYHDFLNREPDASGLDFWSNEIEKCGADAQCREVKRINVSAAFFLSIEFQQTGYFVYRTYKVAYGDASGGSTFPNPHTLAVPVVRFTEFMRDTQEIGQGVVVGQGNWQQQIEDNKQAFALEFVSRSRFASAFPSSMTADEFVSKLDSNAGGVLSDSDKAQLDTLFGGPSASSADSAKRAQALRQVAESASLQQRESDRAFVLMQYFGYLRRDPDGAPDADYTGFDFWLRKLDQFHGNFIQAEMVKAFITSDEYRHRFGQ